MLGLLTPAPPSPRRQVTLPPAERGGVVRGLADAIAFGRARQEEEAARAAAFRAARAKQGRTG
jgi:hypothetical protein